MKREHLIAAVAAELDERVGRCVAEHAEIGAAIADRLGVIEEPTRPAVVIKVNAPIATARTYDELARDTLDAMRGARRSFGGARYLFVRQQPWIPTATAARFEGVVLTARTSRGRTNRSRSWCEAVREAGTELALIDLMLPPGTWRPGLGEAIQFAADVGAKAYVLDIEPTRETATDWRERHSELEQYCSRARELCDARRLELWVTSWALPSAAPTFPWLELFAPAHRAITQPYEVHGRAGAEYTKRCVDEYEERGARRVIVGRGAHELDKSDRDAWRTPAQIAEHKRSTPADMDTAWWCPAGPIPPEVVDAILR